MTTQIIVRLDERRRQELNRLSRAEGKATSQVVRELIDGFIMEHDISGYIDGLWERIGDSLSRKGYSRKDVPRVIRESRKAAK
jgi:predicted DNA-binding protein